MSKEEIEKGRIPLWLDPNDILFLLTEWRKIPSDAGEDILKTWSNIAFRASTSLHKNGIKNDTPEVLDSEKYKLNN
jgi:hypothetical protein